MGLVDVNGHNSRDMHFDEKLQALDTVCAIFNGRVSKFGAACVSCAQVCEYDGSMAAQTNASDA